MSRNCMSQITVVWSGSTRCTWVKDWAVVEDVGYRFGCKVPCAVCRWTQAPTVHVAIGRADIFTYSIKGDPFLVRKIANLDLGLVERWSGL